jgi:hypothetical protein
MEGTIAGVIGATVVAAWFLIVDSIAGHALVTPAVLGASLFDVVGRGGERPLLTNVAFYTVVHYAAFVVVGIVAANMVRVAARRPSLGMLFGVLFVVFELGFFAWTAVLAHSPVFRTIAWYQFGAANLLAALVMGRHIWHTYHPATSERWLQWVQAGHGQAH